MKQLSDFIPKLSKRQALGVLAGMVAGVLLFGLVRFVAQPETGVHYHANFGVFINGVRQEFKGAQYYQEVASCSSGANPQSQVHMHDNVGHVVHVHDNLMTWSNFFSILGWSLHERAVFDGGKVYVDGNGNELTFILNGKPVRSIANEVIGDEDRLLISYGAADEVALRQQYQQLEADAHEYNQRQDPSACKGPEDLGVWRRLQRAFWF